MLCLPTDIAPYEANELLLLLGAMEIPVRKFRKWQQI